MLLSIFTDLFFDVRVWKGSIAKKLYLPKSLLNFELSIKVVPMNSANNLQIINGSLYGMFSTNIRYLVLRYLILGVFRYLGSEKL